METTTAIEVICNTAATPAPFVFDHVSTRALPKTGILAPQYYLETHTITSTVVDDNGVQHTDVLYAWDAVINPCYFEQERKEQRTASNPTRAFNNRCSNKQFYCLWGAAMLMCLAVVLLVIASLPYANTVAVPNVTAPASLLDFIRTWISPLVTKGTF